MLLTNFNNIIDLCHNLSYIESNNESDNKTVVNTYNGEGRRVKKQVLNGSTTKYLYDGKKVIAEFFDDNSVKAVNVYGLNLVLRFGAVQVIIICTTVMRMLLHLSTQVKMDYIP